MGELTYSTIDSFLGFWWLGIEEEEERWFENACGGDRWNFWVCWFFWAFCLGYMIFIVGFEMILGVGGFAGQVALLGYCG
jgi:hypothetical protein